MIVKGIAIVIVIVIVVVTVIMPTVHEHNQQCFIIIQAILITIILRIMIILQ